MHLIVLLRNAGHPDDPAMHGIIAGLWSSLSGLGRFVSRVGTGMLVDFIGFDPTAAIASGLQVIIVSKPFVLQQPLLYQVAREAFSPDSFHRIR